MERLNGKRQRENNERFEKSRYSYHQRLQIFHLLALNPFYKMLEDKENHIDLEGEHEVPSSLLISRS
jgi:hypothetical protein